MKGIWLSIVTILGGCATPQEAAQQEKAATPATSSSVVLSGTNGDMGRYLGTWTSTCGQEFRLSPEGTGKVMSIVSVFQLTAVYANTVKGTLTVNTYPSRDCTGTASANTADVVLQYSGAAQVLGTYEKGTTFFTGAGDSILASTVGSNPGGDTFSVGFRDNFSKFQIAPFNNFSNANLVYSKQ